MGVDHLVAGCFGFKQGEAPTPMSHNHFGWLHGRMVGILSGPGKCCEHEPGPNHREGVADAR